MIECLKRIIREYQNLEPPGGLLPRRVGIGSLPGKVSVVTGVKGSGKTTLLRQRIRQLIESGVPREVTVSGSLLPSPEEETASPLTGRIVSWEIFPLSFREFLDGKGIESEVRSLSEAMVELAVAEGTIVTWRTDETIPVGFGTIRVVPVSRFLLEMEPRS
jgi:predicted AAA+ superfamily ATPase